MRSHIRAKIVAAGVAVLLIVPASLRAGDWPSWRGPSGAGYSDEKELPLSWGGKTKENVLWKIKVDGRGYSSPVVWGDRVFVTSSPKQKDQEVKDKIVPDHHVSCFQASDGKELWRTTIPHGPWADGNSYAIPTPVADGKRLYVWFGSGVAAALDFDGKIVWRRERPGPYSVYPSLSSSPLLYKDSILILCDQSKDSVLFALDKNSGDIKWEEKRPAARSTNSSPILVRIKDQDQMLVAGAKELQGLDPSSGKVLWRCAKDSGYWTSLTYGSGLVYADSGGGRRVVADPTGAGDVNTTHVKWQQPKTPEGLGAPIIVGDFVYRAHKPGMLTCCKLSSGEKVYAERLTGISFLSSPIATADGRIYFVSTAKSFVIKAGPKFEILATNQLDGGDDGPSPAVAGGRIFLRGGGWLICVGTK